MNTRSHFDGSTWRPASARYRHDGTAWHQIGGAPPPPGGGVATPGGAGDLFAQRIVLSSGTSYDVADTSAFTREAGEPDIGGNADSVINQFTVWFEWTAPADGEYTFDTLQSDYDTTLAAYTASVATPTFADLTLRLRVDDTETTSQSVLTTTFIAGQKVYIQAAGFSDTGYGHLVLAYPDPSV